MAVAVVQMKEEAAAKRVRTRRLEWRPDFRRKVRAWRSLGREEVD